MLSLVALLLAAALPAAPAPPQPFPHILTDAFTFEFVAPGVSYAEYAMQTKDGPLEVYVVAADTREPTVRIDSVLANDSLISRGELPTTMAARTGAVAGINADYFDIGNTNVPLGVVVHGGQLVHTPNAHSAFAITRDRQILMSQLRFSGTAQVGTIPLPFEGINEWPPRVGVSLITPAFGSLPVSAAVMVAQLTPLDVVGATVGRYRIQSVANSGDHLPRGYWLAISDSAAQTLGTPQTGDVVTLSETSTTGFANFAAAVGGGPLLLHQGARYYEENAPAAAEGRTRIPISAAALRSDGMLLLVEVDGREPFHSIGLTRDEFTSFLLGLGVTEAISFDGGGSSAIVARRLGDRNAALRNEPSDGVERPVADGLFIYSDAPYGQAARLAIHPNVIRAFPGAIVSIATAATDNAGHPVVPSAGSLHAHASPAALGTLDNENRFLAASAGEGTLHVVRGALFADVPVHIVDRAARIQITPRHLNVRAGQTQRFEVHAYDSSGYQLAVPAQLAWSTSSGHISGDGIFTAGDGNATVAVRIGDSTSRETVTVGEHEQEFQMGTQWHLTTVPADGPGDLTFGTPCSVCIQLSYDFTDTERDATMAGNRPLPEQAIGLRLDVNGDGNGEVMRISLLNAINERVYLTVGPVTWHGWQSKEVRFPTSLAVPAQLHSIYVLNGLGSTRIHTAGSIAIRNVRVILAGK
ncbi:MAG: phosphodiester glycosidase family protein [Candidatus Eremiobacteraeota bacterium]|nr:phosphodiester glycosidase family protein [Candidatus Eremiobacteraeota bacterium]